MLLKSNQVLTEINAVQSFELEFMLDLISEGYLGETTDRKDDIFRGCRGRLTIHMDREGVFDFINAVVRRARTASNEDNLIKFQILAQLDFPQGQTLNVTLPDVRFGSVPVNVGDRGSYPTMDIEFEASEYNIGALA
jgi:hypothetical protein